MFNKYAYLIIADNDCRQLQLLLNLLDDSRNDIYIIEDKKSLSLKDVRYLYTRYSKLNILNPIDIYWGDFSLIEAELKLFSASAPKHYKYYHLLSGQDLPLVSQDKIHSFFDSHPHREFIKYYHMDLYRMKDVNMRLKPHILKKHLLSKNLTYKMIRKIYRLILKIIPQISISLSNIVYGSQWMSIDDDLVHYILRYKKWIIHHFHQGILVDELFVPILINKNKYFLKRLYHSSNCVDNNLRYINFVGKNSHPCTWTMSDLPKLHKASDKGYLFSRKFNLQIDSKIIKELYNRILINEE